MLENGISDGTIGDVKVGQLAGRVPAKPLQTSVFVVRPETAKAEISSWLNVHMHYPGDGHWFIDPSTVIKATCPPPPDQPS